MKKEPHIEYKQMRRGDWRWTLRAPNGEIIASGRGLDTLPEVKRSFGLVVKYAPAAVVKVL